MSIFLDDKKTVIEPEKENTQIPAAEQTPAAGNTPTSSASETPTAADAATKEVETIDVQAQENEKRINEQLENLWESGKEQLTDTTRPKHIEPTIDATTQASVEPTKTTKKSSDNTKPAAQSTTEQPSIPVTQPTETTPKSEISHSEHHDVPAIQKDHPIVAQEEHESAELIIKKEIKKE
jgi:hypothetical protein